MMDERWSCSINDTYPGTITVHMYERVPSSLGQIIKVDLTVNEMVTALEALQRALAYHLRMLT